TGEIKAFGFAGPGGPASKRGPANDTPTDLYDFEFDTIGGELAAMFSGGDIGVVLVSESSSFDGGFTASFGGLAKGNIGLVIATCGDGECESGRGEDSCTCPEDCGPPVCGDGVCECEENQGNCCQDCGCGDPLCTTCNSATNACDSNCGNGTCEPNCGENCETCADDCPTTCGDGTCECGENQENCCEDCGCPSCESCVGGVCRSDCGDGTCDPACEDCNSCPTDCAPTCGDGVCECGEDCTSCADDCQGCGDDCCDANAGENCDTCPADCPPTCGDGICECDETNCDCPTDCPSVCGDGCCGDDEDSCSCGIDCPGPCEECEECDGKVTTLTLRYNGSIQNAEITIDAKRGPTNDPVFGEVVNPGDTFTIVGPQSGNPGFFGTLGTEIAIFVNGELNTTIHTSCSVPIGPGLISGDFEVVSGESKNGGLLCPLDDGQPGCGDGNLDDGEECDDGNNEDGDGCSADCRTEGDECDECDGKVTVLTLRFNGSIENAEITIDAKRGPSTDPVFDGLVNPGDEFTLVGPPGGNGGFAGTLGTEIDIFVNGELNTTIHTSCSQPIFPGLVSGDFEVVSGESKNGGLLCPPDGGQPECGDGTVDPGEDCDDGNNEDGDGCSADCRNETDDCDDCDGKVTVLTLRYNGSIENAQITVDAKRGPSTDPVFNAVVATGESFTLTGPPTGNGGFVGTLGTEIKIYVNGELNTTIHTSCSQPIGPGLISGDFEVVSGESKNGGLLCPLDGKANDPLTTASPTLGSGIDQEGAPGTSPSLYSDSGCGAMAFMPLMLGTFMMICVRRWRS
ncbi:MAG: hypothetical protein IH987_06455, partial [Planctomycetes bacterium]|nr:hypothetical protein [Planctomycetota bacterium]